MPLFTSIDRVRMQTLRCVLYAAQAWVMPTPAGKVSAAVQAWANPRSLNGSKHCWRHGDYIPRQVLRHWGMPTARTKYAFEF
jgi:hypothetical protein